MKRPDRPRTIALMLESDGPGGAESLLLQFGETLRERGYQVTPVGPDNGCGWLAEQFRERDFRPATFHLAHPLDWRCATGLASLFRERGIDIVHSHEFTMAVFGAAASLLTRTRHVITMHGGQEVLRSLLGVWRRRAGLRWAFRHSAYAVAVSAPAQEHLRAALRLPPGAVRCIPNGIRFVPGMPDRVRTELGLGGGDLLIAAIGNLYPVKGHAVLLRAMARLEHAVAPHLAIAGRGEEESSLCALAAELGLSERVHLLGQRSDIPDVLAAADLFVLPSLSEGMPVALIEAMCAGLPIVASGVGGIPEMAVDGTDALLVPPGDVDGLAHAIATALADAERRKQLGDSARRRAARLFTVDRMVDAYERLYGDDREPSGRGRFTNAHAADLYPHPGGGTHGVDRLAEEPGGS